MGKLGCRSLNLGQEIGIENQLQHMLGVRTALQLRVGHLVAKRSECRGSLDAFQEIRPAAPVARQECALKDNVRTSTQRRARGLGVVGKLAPRDLHHVSARRVELGQMRGFVGVALLLQKRGVFAVFTWRRPVAAHVRQIEGGCVHAPHKAHEVRGGQEDAAVEVPH